MIFPRLSNWFARATSLFADFGQRLQSTGKVSGFWGGTILGVSLGLLWTPCAGPILAAITTLVATQSITVAAVLITLSYSIGAGVPMFLIAYGDNKVIRSSKFLSAHTERLRRIFGALMILTAVALTFHWDMILQQKITSVLPPVLIEDNLAVKEQLQKITVQEGEKMAKFVPDKLDNYGKAPELTGIVNWINSPPLSLKSLRGKVVLIDFWTYSCINCIRTLPYLKKWYADYKNDGFVIIGVHTPEFEFEKDPKNVALAASRLEVNYPIAQDNDYKTWVAYQNRYWPAHYLVDQKGDLRMVHFGEGSYLETENAIRALLGLSPLMVKESSRDSRKITHETYLGTNRAKSYSPEILLEPDQVVAYDYQGPLQEDKVGLKGRWKVGRNYITSESDASFLDLNFLARQVYLVLAGSSNKPLLIYLDGNLVEEIIVDRDKEYLLVNTSYGRHLLSLNIPKGIKAYAFTFGDQEEVPKPTLP